MTFVNWGIAVALCGTLIILVVAFKFDPVNAVRESKGNLEVDAKLFKELGGRLRTWLIIGVLILGVGTLMQMIGNLVMDAGSTGAGVMAENFGSIVWNVIGYIIAPILASLMAIAIWERYREPKLAIKTVEKTPGKEPAVQASKQGPSRAFYHLNVTNEGKSPAYHCKIAMDFSARGSKTTPFPVTGKWDRSPEPYIEMPVPVEVNPGWMIRRQAVEVPQPFILSFSEAIDIQPGQSEPFGVVVKYDGEQECYAFSAWGYLKSSDHRVPEWKLGVGDHDVRVSITYSGKKSTVAWFSLSNPATALDSVNISASKKPS